MTQNDLANVLAEAFETMAPRRAPDDLLTGVFSATRAAGQRSGLIGRFNATLDSAAGTVQTWAARPAVSFAVLFALLALLLVSAAFIGGALRERPPTGWRALVAEPAPGEQISVTSIVSTPAGFVAAGNSSMPVASQCQNDYVRSQVWTSANGDTWVENAGDSLVGVQADRLVASGDVVYLFGRTDLCAEDEPAPARVWVSTDGASWELLPEAEPFNFGNVPLIVDLNGTLVAAGVYQEPPPVSSPDAWGDPEQRVWISSDGANWQHVYTSPDWYLGYMAANQDTIVAMGTRMNAPGASLLRSTDMGRTWVQVETPSPVPDSVTTISFSNGRFVAIGDNVAFVSTEGETWATADTPIDAVDGAIQLASQPGGFVAIGGERSDGRLGVACSAIGLGPARPSGDPLATLVPATDAPPAQSADPSPDATELPGPSGPSETCVPVPGSGGTWVSADGIEWTRGPDLPQPGLEGGHSSYLLAAGHDGVVAAEMSRSGMIWYAPLSDFRP